MTAALNNHSATLHELGVRYGTDKVHHNYLVVYDRLFAPLRSTARRMLEVGVFRGASVMMWRDYFARAEIVGMDVFGQASGLDFSTAKMMLDRQSAGFYKAAKRGAYGARVNVTRCNHSDVASMERFVGAERAASREYDIIVEDGSHLQRDQQLNLAQLLPLVRAGGYYIIEDINTGFQPYYDEPMHGVNTTFGVLQRMRHSGRFDSKHLSQRQAQYIEQWIEVAVLFAPPARLYRRHMTCVIRKRLVLPSEGAGGISSRANVTLSNVAEQKLSSALCAHTPSCMNPATGRKGSAQTASRTFV